MQKFRLARAAKTGAAIVVKAASTLGDKFDSRDAMFFAGVGALGAGCGLIYPPAGLIAVGLVLTAVSFFGVRN